MEVQVTYADVVKDKKHHTILMLYKSIKESAWNCVFLTSLVQGIAGFAPRATLSFISNKFDTRTREKVA